VVTPTTSDRWPDRQPSDTLAWPFREKLTHQAT
jgi:hypothetical protein